MTDHEIVLYIQELMDGTEWQSGLLESIATVMQDSGYRIRDIEDIDVTEARLDAEAAATFGPGIDPV